VCVLTLVIQYAKRMRRILLSYVVCLAVSHFPTLSSKQHEFQECVNFSTTFVFNILRRFKRDLTKNVYLSACEVPVIVVTHEAKSNLKFLNRFSKNNQKQNFRKIRPTGAEFFYAERTTDGQTWRG